MQEVYSAASADWATGHSLVESYPSAAMKSVYSGALRWLNKCENTHLCSSLYKFLTPRRERMFGRIEREAGSQGKEQKHNNFVVKTSREDGERVTLCG